MHHFIALLGRYEGTWSASFGYNRIVPYTTWVSSNDGGTRPVTSYQTVVDWSPVSGSLRGGFGVVAYAGSKLPENLAFLIEGSKAIEDATSDPSSYVAGFEVEAFQKSERDTFAERARNAVDKIVKSDVMSKAQGDHQRDWNWRSDYTNEATSVLMPVCHIVYEYNGKSYNLWTDGADVSRFDADELPKDVERKRDVSLGFLPLGAALASTVCG